ncbi:MAG: peptidoglycan-binding domain-containing protein [Actinomycetota bacterium]|nr:peptidoglycan-binding domain-containing protein [Actinomycetota bacterium]
MPGLLCIAETPAWVDGIDICEHHAIDFGEVRRRGVRVVVVRAGRGTRQDAHWVEHVRSADLQRLAVGSYWYVFPSHTTAHHQAELWAAAIWSAPTAFAAGHWADVSTTDGLDPVELGRYVASFLRRMDELLGHTVGVFTIGCFWRRNIRFDVSDRPRWRCAADGPTSVDERRAAAGDAFAVRTRAADRGGPGWHRVRANWLAPLRAPELNGLHLVPRGPFDSVAEWQSRWLRSPDVVLLQRALNTAGAELIVDGVYGPATDAAVHTWLLLRRRDRLDPPDPHLRSTPLPSAARTAAT